MRTTSRRGVTRLLAWGLGAALVALPLSRGSMANDAPATRPAETAEPGNSGYTIDAQPQQLAKWFSQLDDADPAIRDAAYDKLSSLKHTELEALKRVVKDSLPLRPAQQLALPEIVKQVYLSGMDYNSDSSEGFLGVSLLDRDIVAEVGEPTDQVSHVGLLVEKCMPGFCGARLLREGDVILSIVERPDVKVVMPQFAQTIRSFSAGEVVHLKVLRQDKVITVPIGLDPRPVELNMGNPNVIEDMQRRRSDAADAYWLREFAPLFKTGTS